MNRKLLISVCLGALAITLATSASGAPERATGTLAIDATFRQFYHLDRKYCPPGLPSSANCLRAVGEADIPGLGHAATTYFKILPGDDDNCFMIQNNKAVIDVAGKGTLELSRPGKICVGPPPRVDGPYEFTVSGGSGTYSRASGTLSHKSSVYAGDSACQCGTAISTWTGTLTVPGLDFDTTKPTITGATSKTVRAPEKAKRTRVRYVVTATDAVDGAVPVRCKPRSGSFFKHGRTKVSCSATDSSANAAKATFTVTVK